MLDEYAPDNAAPSTCPEAKEDDMALKPQQSAAATREGEKIESFASFQAAVFSAPIFQYFDSAMAGDTVVLSRHGVEIAILGPEQWQALLAIEQSVISAIGKDQFPIAFSSHDDFSRFGEQLGEDAIPVVFFGQTVEQTFYQIQQFFRHQRNMVARQHSFEEIKQKTDSIQYVLKISKNLNGIRDSEKLLSSILEKAREVAGADAGSIYVVTWQNYDRQEGSIHFKITQNASVPQNLSEFQIEINHNSVVGSCALEGASINISDLYGKEGGKGEIGNLRDTSLGKEAPVRIFRHDKKWDKKIGYQCRSMVTVPMFDIAGRVIGVIQLINKKREPSDTLTEPQHFADRVIPFDPTTVEYVEIIAHQAGIALENALLTEEKENLFEGFVHASVTAIEQRDPTTSGHSHRVAKLTVGLAQIVDHLAVGPLKDVRFNEDGIKEIEYASLLHDFGKLGVQERVLTKAKKLYPGDAAVIRSRFDQIRMRLELDYMQKVVSFIKDSRSMADGISLQQLEDEFHRKKRMVDSYLEFIFQCNEPSIVNQGGFDKLKEIANFTFFNASGNKVPFLTAPELEALSVSRGSLTRAEFSEIQSHVEHTYEFLRKIPWGSKFAGVPEIAAKHHEKLDGSGYPYSSSAQEIPIQSRMMTIADIFDALTAADRPYKKALGTDKALSILEYEVKAGKVDAELFRIFYESKIYQTAVENNS